MNTRANQAGLGMWNLGYILFTLGFAGMIGIKMFPFYAEHSKIARAVKQCADEGNADPYNVVMDLEKRWSIEGIEALKTSQVKPKRVAAGVALTYEYEATVPLFANAEVLMHFKGEYPVKNAGP